MCVGYAAFSTNLSLKAKGNIKEKTRVIQAWNDTSQTDFHSNFYKQNIVSVTFLDNNNIPSNATESWNVSEDKENGGVMAWVIPSSSDNTKYDLYIGAKGGVIANEDSSWLFYNFRGMSNLNFNNNFDTSNAVNMRNMFCYCTNLTTIDLSTFDTHNVTNMHDMFQMFVNDTSTVLENKLTKIIFGDNFTTQSVTNMSQMFVGCNKLTTIDVSDWDTSKVVDMSSVFAFCSSLTEIDVSGWNTSKVTNMGFLFTDCTKLSSIDLSNFDTSKVTDMQHMFRNCDTLTILNLCSFDTSRVTNMDSMFAYTGNLKQIKVGPNWMTANANITNIFGHAGTSSVTTGQC